MSRHTKYPLLFFIFFLCISCVEEDLFINDSVSVAIDTDAEEDFASQDRWIYMEMKKNYFWADQMKDSLDCNYTMPPDQFFRTLIVDEDRFSYCYPNEAYRRQTKGLDLNESVKLDSIYVIDGKAIGYFYYSGFETEADVTDVILKMKGVDELIIDVRDNPGGYAMTCIYLSSLIVPKEARGKLFCSHRFNSRISRINKEKTGDECTYYFFRDDALTSNRALSLDRLYVLTGQHSASASEKLINCLRPYMPVVVIGSKTTGKDVGMSPLSSKTCKYVLMPITYRSYNADGNPVPTTGIVPDIYVEDTNPELLGSTEEPLLGRALQEIINN